MGKHKHSKDRMFITQSEHKYLYGGKKEEIRKAYKCLPFDCCAISLSPFKNPVCTREGHIFDVESIVPYLKQQNINPVTGGPLAIGDLIKLHFSKNSDEKYFCPVTYKVFTNNTKIAAIKTSGYVYSYDAVHELNVKANNWTDLITGDKFKKTDIIILQDPQNPKGREIENFEHLRKASQAEKASQADQVKDIRMNSATSRIFKELEEKKAIKRQREKEIEKGKVEISEKEKAMNSILHQQQAKTDKGSKLKYSNFTDGKCSSGFTSTVYQPTTQNDAAIASEEEVLNIRWQAVKKMKKKGYVQLKTNYGDINFELHCDMVPTACDNFLSLCQNGYYNGVVFHRLIKGFMIQGGDPNGTGTGGDSLWKKPFKDEPDSRLNHDSRGLLCMANSGPNTNGSQFYITFQPCSYLDYKHTIFGRVVGGMNTLDILERIPTDAKDHPLEKIEIINTSVFVNPFQEYEDIESGKKQPEQKKVAKLNGTVAKVGGKWVAYSETLDLDDTLNKNTTITSLGIGKYMQTNSITTSSKESKTSPSLIDESTTKEKSKKKIKTSKTNFQDFSGW